MRNEIVVEGKNAATYLSLWTGYFKIDVDGRKVFETYKLTYISIIVAIFITILMVLTILIRYQIGYDMGMQGIPPLSRISKID